MFLAPVRRAVLDCVGATPAGRLWNLPRRWSMGWSTSVRTLTMSLPCRPAPAQSRGNSPPGVTGWGRRRWPMGVVYAGSEDNNVYALNASTGAEIWQFPTGNIVEDSPVVANGVVYFGSGDFNVYAVNATTGVEVGIHHRGRRIRFPGSGQWGGLRRFVRQRFPQTRVRRTPCSGKRTARPPTSGLGCVRTPSPSARWRSRRRTQDMGTRLPFLRGFGLPSIPPNALPYSSYTWRRLEE